MSDSIRDTACGMARRHQEEVLHRCESDTNCRSMGRVCAFQDPPTGAARPLSRASLRRAGSSAGGSCTRRRPWRSLPAGVLAACRAVGSTDWGSARWDDRTIRCGEACWTNDLVLPPDPQHGGRTDPNLGRHLTTAPVREAFRGGDIVTLTTRWAAAWSYTAGRPRPDALPGPPPPPCLNRRRQSRTVGIDGRSPSCSLHCEHEPGRLI